MSEMEVVNAEDRDAAHTLLVLSVSPSASQVLAPSPALAAAVPHFTLLPTRQSGIEGKVEEIEEQPMTERVLHVRTVKRSTSAEGVGSLISALESQLYGKSEGKFQSRNRASAVITRSQAAAKRRAQSISLETCVGKRRRVSIDSDTALSEPPTSSQESGDSRLSRYMSRRRFTLKSSMSSESSTDGEKRIGDFTPAERLVLIQKYLEKRKRRVWTKKIKYSVRKTFADSRVRVKGRFISKEHESELREMLMLVM